MLLDSPGERGLGLQREVRGGRLGRWSDSGYSLKMD